MNPLNVHVVGCPRSGTTLMAEMLVACYEHDGHSEHEESIFNVMPHDAGIRLSKKPNDVLWVGALLARDPNLHVIAMLRDPRSVICSMHKAWPGMYFCNYPVWKRAEKALLRIMRHPRVVVVRYEDLVVSPDMQQKRVEDALPFLKRMHDFERFHEFSRASTDAENALGGVRGLEQARLTGWKEHLPRLKQQLLRYPQLAEDVVRHGYEESLDWTWQLQDVEPKDFPCRYSDSSEFWKHIEQKLRFIGKRKRYFIRRGL